MRAVLPLALVLAAVMLALRLVERFDPGGARAAGGELAIVAAAKGPLLPGARLGAGPELLYDVVLVGDRVLRPTAPEPGVRLARIAPGATLAGFEVHDTRSPAGARALLEACRAARAGEVLVLATFGRVEPHAGAQDPALARQLRGLAAELGARARPFGRTPESWALVAARERGGWRALAEAYAEDVGVAVSWTLAPGAEAGPTDFVRARLEERGYVRLDLELDAASHVRGVRRAETAVVGAFGLSSLVATSAEAASVRWEGVPLGSRPRLRAGVGISDATRAPGAEARFEVLVDGELVHAVRLGGAVPAPSTWWSIDVDLAGRAGRSVQLELRASATGSAEALWGWPILEYEP